MSDCLICYNAITKKNKHYKFDRHDILVHAKCIRQWYKIRPNICPYCNDKLVKINSKNKLNIIEHCRYSIKYMELLYAIESKNLHELNQLRDFVNSNNIEIFENIIDRNDFELFRYLIEIGYNWNESSDQFYQSLSNPLFTKYVLENIKNECSYIKKINMFNILVYSNNYSGLILLSNLKLSPKTIDDNIFDYIILHRQIIIFLYLFCKGYFSKYIYEKIFKIVLVFTVIFNISLFIFRYIINIIRFRNIFKNDYYDKYYDEYYDNNYIDNNSIYINYIYDYLHEE
jgi:hypothetical protein